jgi:hypothetical protein
MGYIVSGISDADMIQHFHEECYHELITTQIPNLGTCTTLDGDELYPMSEDQTEESVRLEEKRTSSNNGV